MKKGMAKLEIGLCRGKKMTSANLKEQDTNVT
jgi:tmRNA-binding protein